jgi:ElaB/YqjD/DUF883 family membrane-anchored ribosome-binding protein
MRNTELNTDNLITDIKRVVRDSEELLQNTTGMMGEKANEVRERLADSLKAARQTYTKIENKTVQGARAADKRIREHPYQSIGAAFGIGLLIGIFIKSK